MDPKSGYWVVGNYEFVAKTAAFVRFMFMTALCYRGFPVE